ncbi:CoA ester lyase [Bradyrhizobium sp. LHD-71]|uniref:HpcH/HpaI aldolase/citrate lyase family protein n=1 Tax=Bradyrhizobium sp. LHD-71 TaxID=3072141 RepID=UPI00280FC10E|nr:CoA ester lyase [Bradyrhizobium sp. LHD-71]MDQ8729253.1 CoA ester lyase [Bradyrhizobium sp. LHD-71]
MTAARDRGTAVPPLMRSKLFVPGSRPGLFAKAAASAADALSFDLEDAVASDRKADARRAVAAWLQSRAASKVIVVRVNGWSSGLFEQDLQAVVQPGLDIINLPMVESADEVREAARLLDRREAAADIARPIGLLANIETPKGLRMAAEIATASERVVGLQIGYADLFEPFAIDRRDLHALNHVRVTVRLAAAEAKVPAYDGAFAGVAEPDLFRAECEAAQRLGFAGKSCIHPSQVPIANACFVPRPAEVEQARRILAAASEAAEQGVGAFVVDGRMIDEPFLVSARAVVALHEQHQRSLIGEGRQSK